jgi:hypothetical protein
VAEIRVAGIASAVALALWLMLDSRLVSPEPGPRFLSLSLGGLAALFGVGAWAMAVGGRRERAPLLAGLAIGVGGYAVLRLVLGLGGA